LALPAIEAPFPSELFVMSVSFLMSCRVGILLACAMAVVVNATSSAAAWAAEPASARTLRHVVLFKFKDSSTPADVARIVEAFRGLPQRIPEIKGFEWGTNVSPEGKAEGFTHCFFVSFATEADRDAYLPHPAHKEFVGIVGPHVDKVCVVDYWTQP
jgi:hypothetical protein